MKCEKMNEFELIKTLWEPLSLNSPYALKLEDDAAIIPLNDVSDLVISKDMLCEETHFLKGQAPKDVARRLFHSSISDLAAMGATPLGYFLAIAATENTNTQWLEQFSKALHQEIKTVGGALLGGDTTRADNKNLVLSLTVLGTTPKDGALKRNSAQIGDYIYVSGTIGDSYLGLQALQQQTSDNFLTQRYRHPQARIALGEKIGKLANAATDISDGLLADLTHICHASQCGATIYQEQIPLSPEAKEYIDLNSIDVTRLLSAGDDYELIFTAAEKQHNDIMQLATESTTITHIGQITDTKEVLVLDKNNQTVDINAKGYQHDIAS